jgi:AraC-like DNA-binding protein
MPHRWRTTALVFALPFRIAPCRNEAAMPESLLVWNIALAGFGAALGLFFAMALWLQRSVHSANDFAAAFCACFALLMVADVGINALGLDHTHWSVNALDAPFLLLPPLFYFYVSNLVTGLRPHRPALLLALVPAALVGVWFVAQLAMTGGQPTGTADRQAEFMPAAYTIVFAFLAVAQLGGYCIAAFQLLRGHAKNVVHNYSSLRKVNLRWVQSLIWAAAAMAFFWMLGLVLQHAVWAVVNAALPPLMILALGVMAQRQMPVMALQPQAVAHALPSAHATSTSPTNVASPNSPAASKYAKSGLTNERMQALADQLAQFMAIDKAFLEGELTLGQLAERMQVPQHHISQVLNQHLACSFFEYINRLRVQEAQRCLADPAFSGQTVLEVGLAAGFNSKAAFNTAFKRFTGTTPTAYRAQPR